MLLRNRLSNIAVKPIRFKRMFTQLAELTSRRLRRDEPTSVPVDDDGLADDGLPGTETLTPVHVEEERMRVYKAMFDKAFADPSVHNIALSGANGSGKSSIMMTLRKRDEDSGRRRYLTVSLAHFQTLADPKSGSENRGSGREVLKAPAQVREPAGSKGLKGARGNRGEERGEDSKAAEGVSAGSGIALEDAVERGIFNQLVYKVPSCRVPRLRVDRKADRPWWFDAVAAGVLVAAFCCLSLVIRAFADPIASWGCGTRAAAVFTLCAAVLGVFLLLRHRPLSGLAVSLNLGGNKVDLAEAKDLTFFDRHIDDVVYLINGSGCDVVVFEDIDRFMSERVFEKLREINALANDARGGDGEPLRFVYLARDDLFSSKDRTKFFDFIIPVIPYIDAMNAPNGLSERLEGAGFDVEPRLRHGIGLYIDESRTLTEIVNGAVQYREALRGSFEGKWGQGDDTHLLALAAYKVLFPADFARLQEGKGAVAWLLGRREEALGAVLAEIDGEIQGEKERIEEMRREPLRDEIELVLLYAGMNGRWITDSDVYYRTFSPSLPKKLPDLEGQIQGIRNGGPDVAKRYQEMQDLFAKDEKYAQRLSSIRERNSGGIGQAEVKIAQLESEKRRLEKTGLAELLQSGMLGEEFFRVDGAEFDIDDIVCDASEYGAFANDPNFPLVRFLIVNGYIDRTYERHISEFRKGAISLSDRAYLKAVVSFGGTDPAYEFDKPAEALCWLAPEEWHGGNARNYSLVQALVSGGDAKCMDALFGGIRADGDVRFLAGHAASGRADGRFFREMETRWPGAVEAVVGSDLSEGDKRVFARSYLTRTPTGVIPQETLCHIGRFASCDPLFLERDEISNLNAWHLRVIEYRAEALDVKRSDPDLTKWVFAHGMYAPDAKMLLLALKCLCGVQEEDALRQGLLTCTFASGHEGLIDYVDNHIVELVQSQIDYVNEKGWIREGPSTLVRVLNDGKLGSETRGAWLPLVDGDKINHIKSVNDKGLWQELLNFDRIACTAENIFAVIGADEGGFSQVLAGFLNRNGIPDGVTHETEVAAGLKGSLLSAACRAPDLSLERLKEISSRYGSTVDARGLERVSDERCAVLVESQSVAVDAEGLESMRKRHPSLCAAYASQDVDSYIALVVPGGDGELPCAFDQGEALGIFANPNVPAAAKVALLSACSEPIALSGTPYPDELVAEIVGQERFGDDFGGLAAMCDGASERVRREVEDAFCRALATDADGVPDSSSANTGSSWTCRQTKDAAVVGRKASRAARALEALRVGTAPFCLIADVLGNDGVAPNNKKELVMHCARTFERNRLAECFSRMGLADYAALITGKGSRSVPNTPFDANLVTALQGRGFCGISEPTGSSDRLRVYCKRSVRD